MFGKLERLQPLKIWRRYLVIYLNIFPKIIIFPKFWVSGSIELFRYFADIEKSSELFHLAGARSCLKRIILEKIILGKPSKKSVTFVTLGGVKNMV